MNAHQLKTWLEKQAPETISTFHFSEEAGLDPIGVIKRLYLISRKVFTLSDFHNRKFYLNNLEKFLEPIPPRTMFPPHIEAEFQQLHNAWIDGGNVKPADIPDPYQGFRSPRKKKRKKSNRPKYNTRNGPANPLWIGPEKPEIVDGGMDKENKGGDIWPVKKR